MHEWALAESVVLTADKTAKERGFLEVEEITIKLGGLQQIDKGIFLFALEELARSQGALFEKTSMKILKEEASFQCRSCGHEWVFGGRKKRLNFKESEAIHFVPEVAHVHMKCPKCQSPDFRILKGRGVWIDSITGKAGD